MILDSVVLFLIGLYSCYSNSMNSYDRDENVTHESNDDKKANHSYDGVALILLILIFMYLNRYYPHRVGSSLMGYIGVSIVAIICVYFSLKAFQRLEPPEWMKVLLSISLSLFLDGLAMTFISYVLGMVDWFFVIMTVFGLGSLYFWGMLRSEICK